MSTSTQEATGVSVGPTTKVGVAATAAMALIAAIAAVLGGDRSTETVTALGGALVTLITVLAGRYAQATALARPAAQVLATGTSVAGAFDESEHDDLPPSAEGLEATEVLRMPPDVGDGGAQNGVAAGRLGERIG